MSFSNEKLLVANRGEIAVRILRTAKRLGLKTVAVYTKSDATAPHVLLADETIALHPDDTDLLANSRGYLDADAIVDVCRTLGVTLVHPGYGFLAENASFASALAGVGVTWLGPEPGIIHAMGLKHEARSLAIRANVPVVPGSDGLVTDAATAVKVASDVGFPIMLKSTAGGGGMGLVVCANDKEVEEKFPVTQQRAKVRLYLRFCSTCFDVWFSRFSTTMDCSLNDTSRKQDTSKFKCSGTEAGM